MTKPREKTRDELTAEIQDGKKKIRQYENRERMLRQKLSREERRTEKGTNLITILPDNIKSPGLTAEWESMLKQVEQGELCSGQAFEVLY